MAAKFLHVRSPRESIHRYYSAGAPVSTSSCWEERPQTELARLRRHASDDGDANYRTAPHSLVEARYEPHWLQRQYNSLHYGDVGANHLVDGAWLDSNWLWTLTADGAFRRAPRRSVVCTRHRLEHVNRACYCFSFRRRTPKDYVVMVWEQILRDEAPAG